MEELIAEWGGETVITRRDKPTGAWIFIAIHSTRLGTGVGGTRMKSYPDTQEALRDAMRLAEGMTYKFATPGMPFGGAKAVIAVPESFEPEPRAALLRRYGALIEQLGGLFSTGPDVGTTPADMDIIAEAGAPNIFARTPAAGGSGEPGPFTALGVFAGIEVVCERIFGESSVKDRWVLVQGVGDVGRNLIRYLHEAGAEVVISDIDEGVVSSFRKELGLESVPPEAVYATECDVFAPCALGGILNSDTIPQLTCRAVAGGANNQLDRPEDADLLRERSILYAPDYVINVGGAMAILGMEIQGWSRDQAENEVVESVQSTLRAIFNTAASDGISTETAARQIAEKRLSEAAQPQ